MKKSTKMLAFVALFAAGLSFSSCAKIYECECTPVGGGTISKYEIAASSKKEAKLECEEANKGTFYSSCKLR